MVFGVCHKCACVCACRRLCGNGGLVDPYRMLFVDTRAVIWVRDCSQLTFTNRIALPLLMPSSNYICSFARQLSKRISRFSLSDGSCEQTEAVAALPCQRGIKHTVYYQIEKIHYVFANTHVANQMLKDYAVAGIITMNMMRRLWGCD